MKLIILFILSINAQTLTIKERVRAVKHFRISMIRCGFKNPNMALFKKRLIKKKKIANLACIEIRSKNIENEIANATIERGKFDKLIKDYKKIKCKKLGNDFNKKTCKIIKGLI